MGKKGPFCKHLNFWLKQFMFDIVSWTNYTQIELAVTSCFLVIKCLFHLQARGMPGNGWTMLSQWIFERKKILLCNQSYKKFFSIKSIFFECKSLLEQLWYNVQRAARSCCSSGNLCPAKWLLPLYTDFPSRGLASVHPGPTPTVPSQLGFPGSPVGRRQNMAPPQQSVGEGRQGRSSKNLQAL